MAQWVEVDGSTAEGGGQILGTALSLSLITGKAFRIRNTRSGHGTPGLAPEQLTAVRACAVIGDGETTGAKLGAQDLTFTPGQVQAGNYRFDIGTGGSTTSLAQALLWPLALQPAPSTVTLIGATHGPGDPTFEYLSLCWAPTMRRLGVGLGLLMPRAGFYPAGGGELRLTVRGSATLHGVRWGVPVVFDAFTGVSFQTGMGEEVAARQAAGACEVLEAAGIYCPVQAIEVSAGGPGSAIALVAGSRFAPVCATALGKSGADAQAVGREAAEALVKLVAARAPVDPYGALQLLIPLALAREPSTFLMSWPAEHLPANARVIEQFLPVRIGIEPELRGRALVRVEPRGG